MSRLTERYKEKVFCKADCSEMIDYAEDCECPHLQKMKEKLAHYEDLEEQKLLIKLPCKVGDEFWELNDVNEPFIYPRKALTIQHCVYVLERLGRKAFLTKAEAEKALAEMEK